MGIERPHWVGHTMEIGQILTENTNQTAMEGQDRTKMHRD